MRSRHTWVRLRLKLGTEFLEESPILRNSAVVLWGYPEQLWCLNGVVGRAMIRHRVLLLTPSVQPL